MNSSSVRGRDAASSGGAGELGAALVTGLARPGVATAVLDLNHERARARADEVRLAIGPRALRMPGDGLDLTNLHARWGRLEGAGRAEFLIHAAGGRPR